MKNEFDIRFAVPKSKEMIKELMDYSTAHGFGVKIEGNVAEAVINQSIFDDKNFQSLLLKLENAFEEEDEQA